MISGRERITALYWQLIVKIKRLSWSGQPVRAFDRRGQDDAPAAVQARLNTIMTIMIRETTAGRKIDFIALPRYLAVSLSLMSGFVKECWLARWALQVRI